MSKVKMKHKFTIGYIYSINIKHIYMHYTCNA